MCTQILCFSPLDLGGTMSGTCPLCNSNGIKVHIGRSIFFVCFQVRDATNNISLSF